ncbi:MAG TPA: hypothetical protein P5294_00635 [Smithellaceae bacterium]|nr:hypothetical protein [Smithellaceae bacterium]HRS88368.1 hypothetical protein [Smithellaceae bacterium]HRV25013.1 hypothetical protein [Smithellaceae bacterium]
MHDLIIIGDDLSSYVAAAVGIKFGLNTVHLTEHNLKEMSINDIYFNADSSPITGFGEDQSAISLFNELGIKISHNDLCRLNPCYQVILPDHRVDFYTQKNDLIAELVREFPHKTKYIKSFFKSVQKDSDFLQKWVSAHPFFRITGLKQYFNYFKLFFKLLAFDWKTNKFRRKLFDDPSLLKIHEAQLAFFSSDIDARKALSSSYHYSAPWRGTFSFPKGKTYLFETLRDFFKNAGGLYMTDCRLLSVRKTNCIEAELMDERGLTSQISAKYLIISDKAEALNVFYKKKKKIKTNKWLKRVKTTHYPFTLHFVLTEKCLPEKLARHAIFIPDINNHIFNNNMIILEIHNPDKEKKSTQGKILLAVTVFLPADEDYWKKEMLKKLAENTITRLETFLPFLGESTKFYDINKSIDISIKYRNIANAKYRVKKSFFTGFSAQKNKTSIKGVYLNGASLFTDMGCFESEIISGMYAVYSILKAEKKS